MPKAGWSPPGAQTRVVRKFAVLSMQGRDGLDDEEDADEGRRAR